jgi:hypothetical protein
MLTTALLMASLLPAGAADRMPCARIMGGERMAVGAATAEHDLLSGKKRNRRPRGPRNRSGLPIDEEDNRADSSKAPTAGFVAWVPCLIPHFLLHAHPADPDAISVRRYLVLHVLLI